MVSKYASFHHLIDPHLPIFPTHDGNGIGNIFICTGLDGNGRHNAGMEIHGFVGEHSTQWFQYGAMGDTRFRMCAHRRSKAIDDEINLAKVLFDEIDGFVFDLIGECITINALSIEAGFLGFLLKGGTVVPSGGCGFAFLRGLFKEHTDGGSATAEGGRDAGTETEAS